MRSTHWIIARIYKDKSYFIFTKNDSWKHMPHICNYHYENYFFLFSSSQIFVCVWLDIRILNFQTWRNNWYVPAFCFCCCVSRSAIHKIPRLLYNTNVNYHVKNWSLSWAKWIQFRTLFLRSILVISSVYLGWLRWYFLVGFPTKKRVCQSFCFSASLV